MYTLVFHSTGFRWQMTGLWIYKIPFSAISRDFFNLCWTYCKVKVISIYAYIIKHSARKTYGGSGDIASPFLTPALHGEECWDSRPCRFASGVRATGIHWVGDLVGLRACLGAMEKINISSPFFPARILLAVLTELSRPHEQRVTVF
jgi:hypothetical protein